MFDEFLTKYNEELGKVQRIEDELNEVKNKNKSFEKMQEIVKDSKAWLEQKKEVGLEDILTQENILVERKFEEKKNAYEEKLRKMSGDVIKDFNFMKDEIKKELDATIAERKNEFDEAGKQAHLKMKQTKVFSEITKLWNLEAENRFATQKLEEKLKYSDITDKLNQSMMKLDEDIKKKVEELKSHMKENLFGQANEATTTHSQNVQVEAQEK